MEYLLSLIGRVSVAVIIMWVVWLSAGVALFIYTGRSLGPVLDTNAGGKSGSIHQIIPPIHIEQTNPVNSPNVIGNNNQVTVGGGPPAERSFCPDRGLVQSAAWNHDKLGCTEVTTPWEAPGWEQVEAIAELTVLVIAPPNTSPIAHLRIIDVTSGNEVAERAIREVRSSPSHVEYQGIRLVVPRAKGTHSYRLEFRTEDKAALKVTGPMVFTHKWPSLSVPRTLKSQRSSNTWNRVMAFWVR